MKPMFCFLILATALYRKAQPSLEWSTRVGTIGYEDKVGGTQVDRDGNIYVASKRAGEHYWEDVMYLTKMDTRGHIVWSRTWEPEEGYLDHVIDLVVGELGNAIVLCEIFPGNCAVQIALIKYSSAGVRLWTKIDYPEPVPDFGTPGFDSQK